jgi:hypothetical protein
MVRLSVGWDVQDKSYSITSLSSTKHISDGYFASTFIIITKTERTVGSKRKRLPGDW